MPKLTKSFVDSIRPGAKEMLYWDADLNVNADKNLKGFSSFQYYTVCKALKDQGVEKVCIGGSETPGLDHFKRKMNPVKADIRLCTLVFTKQGRFCAGWLARGYFISTACQCDRKKRYLWCH